MKNKPVIFTPVPQVPVITPWQVAPKAQAFTNSHSKPWAELLRYDGISPRILISPLAMAQMHIIVSSLFQEVGWLGTLKEMEDNIYLIDEVFLFRQNVSYGHTVLETESMNDVMTEILSREGGEEIFNTTRFWGHSHGQGQTLPSKQDDDTMNIFEGFQAEYFLRGILNRIGDMFFSFYDWRTGIVHHRIKWEAIGEPLSVEEYDVLQKTILKEMKEKVISITYYTPIKKKLFFGFKPKDQPPTKKM